MFIADQRPGSRFLSQVACLCHHHLHIIITHHTSHESHIEVYSVNKSCMYYWTTGLHTVLMTEPLCSDISFSWVLFQKDTTLCSPHLLPLNSESVLPWSPIVSKPPVFKPCIFFDTPQYDYCIILCLFVLLCIFHIYFITTLISNSYLTSLWPLSDLCLKSVWLPSDSSLQQPFQNYRTYLLNVWVGTTHKLKPSPTYYPLPTIC